MSKNQAKSSTVLSFASITFSPQLPYTVYINSQVLIVGNIMTIIVHFTIEHQVYYDWTFKEQHAKIWENIAGAKRYFRPRGFNIAGASAPSPLHSDAFATLTLPRERVIGSYFKYRIR